MRSAEEYRRNAMECFLLATRAADPHHGYVLRGVANSWMWLANEVEKLQAANRQARLPIAHAA